MDSTPDADAELRRRVRQQEIVAKLGQQALETDDLDRLLHEAVVAVSDVLETEYVELLELLPEGDEFFLRDGVGWHEGLVGSTTVPADTNSQAGITLRTEAPIVVDDVQSEDRLSEPALLTDHGITSGISVIVGSVDEPWGVLGTYATEPREFTDRDATFLRSVANVLGSALENERTRRELEEIYGRISDAFFALDGDWNFTYLNERAHELINPDGKTLVGKRVWDEFPEAMGQQFKAEYERAMYDQETVSFEEYYPDPLGRWFEVRAYPSETGLSVYFRDITERKERQRELELFRTLLDHSNDSVLVIDPGSGRFLDANETACRRLGYDREELLDLTVPEMDHVFDDVADWHTHVEDVKDEGSMTITGEHVRKDGTTYPAEVNVAHVELDREYMIAIARDITEHRERERALEESNERLEQFAYAASHDLQEPLRMVSSYLQLLERRYADEFDEDGEEFLDYAVDGAERMREMIDGLLAYSRVETRGDPFEPVDLDCLLEDVLDDLSLQLEETDAEVETEPLPRVRGDASQLRQVFQNLLANALEYSGPEPPRVHLEAAQREGAMWEVSVVDEGIGIDPEDQDRVFDVFQRLHSREEYDGTGIGLALCERIVERHDGEIWVESEPGEGSTFSVTLPAADESAA
ncbi:multi-sensor signal transduction histidine kinase [Haloterrigena turkmenica DSM 5511]|uniref:histidine kinase n=1 Tax=Haloterrigena turkmenica (strain ATCC 51198 / DSM 5511 / JCM 9101 / NCIMB 13204 / VKM B-1734 / 4k) TaxID=543526 RepID=D2RY34_HALTV|nr:ATP-binding protein [Haloterrigena turkmenica]ADB61780.1 multi-sensor signal transduction histidine kinase [Haloterrigena turkmenica DSM 5511]